MEFEWNIFPGFTTLQLVDEVQKFMNKMSNPAQFQGRISSCRCSTTSYGELKTMDRNVLLMPHLCLCLQKDFQHQKQSGILLASLNHKDNGTETLD